MKTPGAPFLGRFCLAPLIALSFTGIGCDKLGLGDKEDSKATKLDDDHDRAKKKKKKKRDAEEEGDEAEASFAPRNAATTEPSAAPTVAPSASSADSTGIPECDEYVAKFQTCVPDTNDTAKKVRDGLRQGAQHAREQMIKTCKEGIEALSKACPAK